MGAQSQVSIGGRNIGVAYEPFIIAEMSGNHNGSLDRALQIVDAIPMEAFDTRMDGVVTETEFTRWV